jgi:flavodoxin
MKAVVVYDSAYGNTAQVAEAMGEALGSRGEVLVLRARDVRPEQLVGLELLIVGSPTQKFRPLPPVTELLKGLPRDGLRGVKVAAFDTRFPEGDINKVRILAFFVRVFGYAAKPIADRMVKKGGVLAASPEGFYVGKTKGPLLDGELERAAAWATRIAES